MDPVTRRDEIFFRIGMAAIGVFLGVAFFCLTVILCSPAMAEESTVYVICHPDSEVLIREAPGRKKPVVGAAHCGERIWTDWEEENGYLHVIDLNNETGDGWIFASYTAGNEPKVIDAQMTVTGKGRVACRKYPDGKRTRWLKPGDTVTVYRSADGWSITSKGWIRTEYLRGEVSK